MACRANLTDWRENYDDFGKKYDDFMMCSYFFMRFMTTPPPVENSVILQTIFYRVLKTKIRTKSETRKSKKKRGFLDLVHSGGPSAEPQPDVGRRSCHHDDGYSHRRSDWQRRSLSLLLMKILMLRSAQQYTVAEPILAAVVRPLSSRWQLFPQPTTPPRRLRPPLQPRPLPLPLMWL